MENRNKVQETLQVLNRILQESNAPYHKLVQSIGVELSMQLDANVLVCCKDNACLTCSGKWFDEQDTATLDKLKPAKLLALDSGKTNISLRSLHVLPDKNLDKPAVAMPLRSKGAIVGAVLFFKDEPFTDDELLCTEWFAAIVSLTLGFHFTNESDDADRQRKNVRTALGALSYSELEAITGIFAELNANEGLVVASKVADQVGITRSVIVNALRKLESAVVIETRSLGMKGTYIRVTNAYLFEELNKLKM